MKEEAKQQVSRERKMKRMKAFTWGLIVVAVIISIFIYIQSLPPPVGKYDAFAKCIANTSTTFYGAFWCPHCRNQKGEFGSASQYLPYVECSLPDESGQTQVCIDKGIQTYPTWYFPDGSSTTGETSLEVLAERTGCALPDDTVASTPVSSSSPTSLGSSSPAVVNY